ncbi:uncharacterized protein LOC143258684 isoform X2 [Tachypleus tridentatus]
MNQLCKVCNEPAAGYHFGAFTCEGCKSFFGRTYNNLSTLGECKNNGQCVINKKNRTSCKSCRLKKCILVGMSKSGSRYGRRSNWFKIHCLIQDQAEMNEKTVEQVASTNGQFHHENKNLLSAIKSQYREDNTSVTSPNRITQSSDITYVVNFPAPTNVYDTKLLPTSFRHLETSNISPERKENFGYNRISLSPVSPMLPLNTSKFLFQHGNEAFTPKDYSRATQLYKMDVNHNYSYEFLAVNKYDSLLKSSQEDAPVVMGYLADTQEIPIDLSVKKPLPMTNYNLCLINKQSRQHQAKRSSIANVLESPLDLTRKMC